MNLAGLPYSANDMAVSDIPTVVEIENDVFSLPWSSNAFRYEVRENSASVYLVLHYVPWSRDDSGPLLRPVRRLLRSDRLDASLIGYGGYWTIIDEAHICTLAIRRQWRGRGLGELLLASLVKRALQRPVQVITLEVRVGNVVAQNLYAKYGFKIVGRRKGYYSDNGEDALIMSTESLLASHYEQRFRDLTRRLRTRLAEARTPPVPA